MPGMMVAPVPMWVVGVAPRVVVTVTPVPMWVVGVAPIGAPVIVSVRMGAVASLVHDDDGRWDTEADGDIHTGLRRLRLRKQYESQEWDCTPNVYDMGETFHGHILAL